MQCRLRWTIARGGKSECRGSCDSVIILVENSNHRYTVEIS